MQENGRLRPLEPDSLSLEAFHGLLEEILAGRGAGHARDIVLFPLDWRIYMVKNVFDRICDFGANAVARYERHLDGAEREWLDKDGAQQMPHGIDTAVLCGYLAKLRVVDRVCYEGDVPSEHPLESQ